MKIQKRLSIILLGIAALFLMTWVDLYLQKKQHLIGGGLNRTFLFLLINAHVVVIIFLLFLIIRNSIKLFVERRKGVPGSIFKRNLLFSFTLFSVIPSFFVFFTAGKFITKTIDSWFQARLGGGFASALALHEYHTQDLRKELVQASTRIARKILENKNIYSGKQDIRMFAHSYPVLDNCDVYIWRTGPVGLCPNLHSEIALWRTFRTINDRTTKSLKRQLLVNIRDKKLFDFYGSLYCVQKTDSFTCMVAYRYPVKIRHELIGLQGAVVDYRQLQDMKKSVYLTYFFTFFLISILILFLAIWCAFYLARGISKPIQELLQATDKVRQGLWDTRVPVNSSSDLQSLAQGFNDMTRAVREAHERLEIKNKIKTWQEAAKQMAHEIKNPLTPIQLATQRLQRKFKDVLQQDKIFLDCTNTILDQVATIKDLVTHFSQFASLPSPYFQMVDLNALIKEVLCLYQVSYPEIVFVYNVSGDLVLFKTDREKLKLVLINLFDNSVRALNQVPDGTKKIELMVSLDLENKQVNILFSDTGPGIPQSVRDTLFLPYVSTEKKNMGLGLAIVNDIITQLGGLIILRKQQSGACFKISLPL